MSVDVPIDIITTMKMHLTVGALTPLVKKGAEMFAE